MICYAFRPRRKRKGKLCISRLYSARVQLLGDAKPRTIPLRTTDKQVAEKRLLDFVAERDREAEGLLAPKALRYASKRPLAEHLNDFFTAKCAAGRDARYLYELKNRVLKLLKECHWTYAKDITAESFVTWRAGRKRSAKTLNEYLTSIRT